MAWTNEYIFTHPPNQTVLSTLTYLLTDTSERRPKISFRTGGGGVGVFTTPPSCTSASSIIYISPTRVTTSYAPKSCAVTMVLSLRVSDTTPPCSFTSVPREISDPFHH